jgi:ERCC4-related helicase
VTRKCLIEAGEELRYMLEAESVEEERGRLFTAIINQSLALTLFHMLELLETQGLHTLKAFMEKVEAERREKHSYAILTNEQEYRSLKTLVWSAQRLNTPRLNSSNRQCEASFHGSHPRGCLSSHSTGTPQHTSWSSSARFQA